jgi:hypothetical protein
MRYNVMYLLKYYTFIILVCLKYCHLGAAVLLHKHSLLYFQRRT